MLGQPALVAGHHAGDAQGVALLAEQRVAAVPGAVGPDRPLLGELDDVLGVAARPGDVVLAVLERHADRVEGGHELGASSSSIRSQHVGAHPRHHPHRGGDVGGVGDLHAEHRLLGLEVAHHERDDVHRAALHAALVELAHDGLHLVGRHPVVGGTRVLLVDRADVGAVLDARHVGRVGRRVEGVRLDLRVELGEGPRRDQRPGQLRPLLVGPGAPVDPVGPGHGGDLVDEVEDALVGRGCWIALGGARAVVSAVSAVMRSASLSRIRGGRLVATSAPPAVERVDGGVVELWWIARRRCRRLMWCRDVRDLAPRAPAMALRLLGLVGATYWNDPRWNRPGRPPTDFGSLRRVRLSSCSRSAGLGDMRP